MKATAVAVARFERHDQAEDAVKALQRGGIDVRLLSIVGKGYHSEEKVLGFFNLGDRVKVSGRFGAFWGSLAGILLSSALLFVPVFGHLVVLGPLASTVVGGLEGAIFGGGVGALVGVLSAAGIPKDSVVKYEAALKADEFLLMIHADQTVIDHARKLLVDADLPSFDQTLAAAAAA